MESDSTEVRGSAGESQRRKEEKTLRHGSGVISRAKKVVETERTYGCRCGRFFTSIVGRDTLWAATYGIQRHGPILGEASISGLPANEWRSGTMESPSEARDLEESQRRQEETALRHGSDVITWAKKLVELTEWCEAVFARKTSKKRALRSGLTEFLQGDGGNGPVTRNAVVDGKTDGATRGPKRISFEAHQDQTEGRGRERTPRDQDHRVGKLGVEVPSRRDVVGAGDDANRATLRRSARSPSDLLNQGEPRGRGGDGQDRPLRAANIGGIVSMRLDVHGDDNFGATALRQGAQSSVEQLDQGEIRRHGGDFQDRAMLVDSVGGTISTRQKTFVEDDTGGSALRQKSQSHVEQLGQTELRESGEELQDRVALAANIAGVVSTRRDVLDYGDARGAAAGPRDDAGATSGERLQQREADQPKERQPATAQREQLPDEVWRAMSKNARKQLRQDQNRKRANEV